jgi:hypothetical protein
VEFVEEGGEGGVVWSLWKREEKGEWCGSSPEEGVLVDVDVEVKGEGISGLGKGLCVCEGNEG